MTTTSVIRSAVDKQQAAKLVMHRSKYPFTLKITEGAPRSTEQNKLYHKWMNELAEQGDQTAAEYTAQCKLEIGVPILRSEDLEFKEFYDENVKIRPYEMKLKMMSEPYGFPVSSLMKTRQFKQYLDDIYRRYTEQGFVLTEPKDRGEES